ncbi:MAG: N-acetyl-gamma-glutamyl-phosphate reductase [Bacteroidales bacterium]|nr:N-acetyl-gamma-glutamyl-phosphate reductase [Bacteroidales bacterium]
MATDKIKVAIAGGTGYTAGELLRILTNHPGVEIISVMSTTSAGRPVTDFHRDLLGDTDLVFTDNPGSPDVVFLCLGHGLSREFLGTHTLPEGCKIIDLGQDFRNDPDFDGKHFVYGLTDVFKSQIEGCDYLANPGCFATSIQLGLAPAAALKIIEGEIHVTAITGATGAGRKLSETSHFPWRDNNISVYKPFSHQHLEEIGNTLKTLSGQPQTVNFVPVRGDFARGIFASIYFKCGTGADEAAAIYKEYYKGSPFVFVSDTPVSLKEVVNTNKCLLHVESYNGYLHITSIIDNLLKGASGQAVENMNLMFGLERTTALKLKANAF